MKRHTRFFYFSALFCLFNQNLVANADNRVESLSEIEEAVYQFTLSKVESELGYEDEGRIEVEVKALDPRLRLPLCTMDYELGDHRFKNRSRTSVKVQCRGNQPWSIYVPVKIKQFEKVVTSKQAIPKGSTLSREQLHLVERDISGLNQGFFRTFKEVVDRPLKRSIAQGVLITPNLITRPLVIYKGDEVIILAKKGNLSVKMMGTAMHDGRLGRQIAVKNNQSNRIIKAKVIESGLVEVKI